MSNQTVDTLQTFVSTFILLYVMCIILAIVFGFLRLPYNLWVYRVRGFVDDTVNPFLGVFRRLLPSFGPLDLSPMIAIFALGIIQRILVSILDGFRPGG
jgi:YggT family protein